MDFLIIDTNINTCATGQVLNIILQFMNQYIKQNNINLSDINNIYVNKCNTQSACQIIFDDNYDSKNMVKLFLDNTSLIDNIGITEMMNNVNYSYILKKIRFSKQVLGIVDDYLKNFDINTLGIHFRLTDMNEIHTKLSPIKYTDYIIELNRYIENFNIKNIFVASDNIESINKLNNENLNVKIFYRDVKRYHAEKAESKDMIWHKNYLKGDIVNTELNYFKGNVFNIYDPNTHLECIVDCILLSKTKHLIFTHSSISYLAILMSDTITSTSNIFKGISC
jgi:hypothetical protein